MLEFFWHARSWVENLRARAIGERGATAVEYAIMLAFIAAVIVVSVAYLGTVTNSQFEKVTFPP